MKCFERLWQTLVQAMLEFLLFFLGFHILATKKPLHDTFLSKLEDSILKIENASLSVQVLRPEWEKVGPLRK